MKGKVWIYRFLLIVGIGMVVGFIIRLSVDAWKYKMYALPFYYYIIFRVIEFLLPAIFLIITGLVLRKKVKQGDLQFPFGNAPDYVHIVDEDNLVYEWYPYNTDTEKYDITINGNAIEKTVRHTLTYPYAQFNLRKDMELLTDGYIEDEFYYPEQSVTKYTYQISGVDLERYKHEYKGYLMRWYEYEIALEPEERIVNTVIAPIYPSINGRHEPVVYGYKYLLSPAKTWSEFGDLEIRINTPYFLIENSVKEFIKTDEGYSLKLDELPENELEFTLCSSQDPVYAIMPGRDYNPTGMIISIAAGVVLLSVGIIVYVKVRKRRKWNSNN